MLFNAYHLDYLDRHCEVDTVVADGRAHGSVLSIVRGTRVRAVYMEERVTSQLGHGEDLVPLAPLQLTLFPYEAPDEVVNQWRAWILTWSDWRKMTTFRSINDL